MKAMILAAGRGERMRPITDTIPKPLLPIGDKPLIVYHLERLKQSGITDIVINTSYLAEQIHNALGDGSQFGVKIIYSHEPEILETGGGVFQALPHLGDDPFLLISADIWTDYDFTKLPKQFSWQLAHLILVDNPAYHPNGDYVLQDSKIYCDGKKKLTYASMGVLHPQLFANYQAGHFRLGKVFHEAITQGLVSGEHFTDGEWVNVGTLQDWQELIKPS